MTRTGEPAVDVVVVGAGLVGLATAKALLDLRPELRLAVLDKEPRVAVHQSGHNSGVLHAGLYYKPGSMRVQLCQAGRSALIDFAEEHAIPYRITGKLVVAADESELERFEQLRDRGIENGLAVRELERREWRELEPNIVGLRAFHIPESGVIDYPAVAARLAALLADAGAQLVLGEEVVDFESGGVRRVVRTRTRSVEAAVVVCCGGLQADRLARLTGRRSDEFRIVPFRGDYYTFLPHARELVRGLVYPVPDPAFPFLGVHFTRGVHGDLHAGPNAVPSFAREGYGRASFRLRDVAETVGFPGFRRLARSYARTGAAEIWRDLVKPAYVAQMRKYLPQVSARDVRFGPSGIRAQCMKRDGTLVDDFLVEEEDGVLHVLNAPSPAATASLVIGRHIAERALGALAAR